MPHLPVAATEIDDNDIEYVDALDPGAEEEDFMAFCSELADELFDDKQPAKSKQSSKRKLAATEDPSSESDTSFRRILPSKKPKTVVIPFASKSIPRHDIRRSFAQMFADAFNDCDKNQIAVLLRNYCESDVSVSYKFLGGQNPFGPNHTEVIGNDAVWVFWDSLLSSVPDCVFELFETKLRVLPDSASSIVCRFKFSGTRLYKIITDGHWEQKVVVHQETSKSSDRLVHSSTKLSADIVDSSDKVVDSIHGVTALGAALETPLHITLVGTLIYYINPEKRIQRFEFLMTLPGQHQ